MDLVIETLDDVLPKIELGNGFVHAQREGYSVIDYAYTHDDMFTTDIERECRGLKFGPNGRLIARPFHKFFNLGEKQPPEAEPWHEAHLIQAKLDGSMIHAAKLVGALVFMTRGGITKQAEAAWEDAHSNVKALAAEMVNQGFTPIFEYTAPSNRIVIAYPEPSLTLLAIREMRTGRYKQFTDLTELASAYDVPLVDTFGSVTSISDFVENTRKLEDIEGYVIAFNSGHRVKIKTEYYALRHKALDGLSFEKNLLLWITEGVVDDVIPLLNPSAAKAVLTYQASVMRAVETHGKNINRFVAKNGSLSQKDFAARNKSEIDPKLQPIAFQTRAGKSTHEGLIALLKKATSSQTKVDALKPLFDFEWKPISADDGE